MLKSYEKYYKKFITKLMAYKLLVYSCDAVIWAIGHSMPLVFGLIIREFFNKLNNPNATKESIILLVAFYIFSTIFRITIIHIGARVDIYHKFQISGLIYKNIIKNIYKDKRNLNMNYSVGEMVEGVSSDVSMLENTVGLFLDALGHLVFTITALSILFSISIKLTIFIAIPVIIVMVSAKGAKKTIKKLRNNNRILSSKVAGFTSEMFESCEQIKLSGSEEDIVEHLKGMYNERGRAFQKDALFTNLLKNLYSSTVDIGTGIILIVMAVPLIKGQYNIGDFTIFLYYIYYIVDFVQYLGDLLSNFRQCTISIDRLNDTFNKGKRFDLSLIENNVKEDGKDHISIKNEIIKIENLTCKYDGETSGVEDISIEIKPNNITVITGRNGSGKSTILKAITGYIGRQKGEIFLGDKNIDILDTNKYNIVYLPQSPKLINKSIKENILMGLEEKKHNIKEIVFKTDLEKDIGILDKTLETNVGPSGGNLSGGQLQRVSLARTFIRKADLYIIDGIPNALDISTEKNIIERLYSDSTKTYLLTSNNEEILKKADNILVLKDGKIECQGNYKYVLKHSDEIRKIVTNIENNKCS